MTSSSVLAFVLAVLGPIIAGVVLFLLQRWFKKTDEATYTTHLVLRELVRATRELGAAPNLPPGW